MSRATVAIFSAQNLIHNIKCIKRIVGKSKIIAMVKANAYGHDIQYVGSILDDCIDMFGVASIDEALELRKAGVLSPILLAQGIFEENELIIAAYENFHITFHNMIQIEWLMRTNLPMHIHAWLKVDTGMSRLGFNINIANDIYDKLQNHPQVASVKIMSHLACADDINHALNKNQISNFQNFIKNKQCEFSICNSAAIINFPELHYDYVRPGIAVYGVSPIKEMSALDLGLRPVMTLQTELISVQTIARGSYIGYDARYQCSTDMPIGIAACGYADGYSVSVQNNTPILVNNMRCHVIGKVSMDMIAIDLRNEPNAKIGDHVELWGTNLPLEEVANHTNDTTWKLLTSIQSRVKRINST